MQITNRLKAEQMLMPSEYAFRTFKRDHPWRDPEHPYEWSDVTVSRILENEEYTSTQISCKTYKVSYKSDMVIPVPEEEQYRVEDAHEAIIGLETWEIVQRIRAHKRRPVKLGEADLLSGMVFCADCGHTLRISRSGSWDESRYTYVCGTYSGHKEKCTLHAIKALHLRQLTLAAIREVCAQVRGDREVFAARVLDKRTGQLAAKQKALVQMKKHLAELDSLLAKAFEKLASGVLTDEQFQQLSSRYSAEREKCKAHIPQMEAELEAQEANIQRVDQFLKVVDRYLDIQELTLEILHEFVECIVVHERSEPRKKKNYTQKVDSISTTSEIWCKKAERAPEGTPSAERSENIFIARQQTAGARSNLCCGRVQLTGPSSMVMTNPLA